MNAEQSEQLDKFSDHLRVLKGLQGYTVARYRAHVAEFLAWRSGNGLTPLLTAVEPFELQKEVEEYLKWCLRKGNGNTTRLTKLTAIQSFFRHLVYNRVLASDPTSVIPKPPRDSPGMIPFTRSDILRMFGTIDITTEIGLRDAVFLILGAFAGFRVSEITRRNIEDVLDEGDDMNLSIPKTKRNKSRTVWIWKAPAHYVRALLLARLGHGARVGDPLLVSCKNNGTYKGNLRLTSDACDDILKKLARRAGVRKAAIKTHMLRTTHACDCRHIRGYDTFAIMERFGWKNPETAARYITRREPTYRQYNNWHEYWIDFPKVWKIKLQEEQHVQKD